MESQTRPKARESSLLRPRRALLVLDCQAAFLDSSAPISIPESLTEEMIRNLESLLPKFRKSGGDVWWIKTEFSKTINTRPCDGIFVDAKKSPTNESSLSPRSQSSDAYLSQDFQKRYGGENGLLSSTSKSVDMSDRVKALIQPQDRTLVKNEYSAFSIPNLLINLRSRIITELYLAGAHSNISVFATAADAARHGFIITILKDCVVYSRKSLHEAAVEEMEVNLAAESKSSHDLLERLGGGDDPLSVDVHAEDGVNGADVIRSPIIDPHLVEKLVQELSIEDVARNVSKIDGSASDGINSKPKSTKASSPENNTSSGAGLSKSIMSIMNESDSGDSKVIADQVDVDDSEEDLDALIAQTRKKLALSDMKRTRTGPRSESSKVMSPLSNSSSSRRASEDVKRDSTRRASEDIKRESSSSNNIGSERRSKSIPKPISTNVNGLQLGIDNPLTPSYLISPSKTKDQEVLESKIMSMLEARKASMADLRAASRDSFNRSPERSRTNLASSRLSESSKPIVEEKTTLKPPEEQEIQNQLDNVTIEVDDDYQDDFYAIEMPARKSPVRKSEERQASGPPPGYTGQKREKVRVRQKKKEKVTYGPDDTIGEEDDSTSIMVDFLPEDLATTAFERMKTEVAWRVMYHRGGEVPRLVAVEGEILPDGSFPVYRHPADESPPLLPFSPTVAEIRKHVEKALKHPVNHVLIQHYRTGSDYISEHSDKTLDIAKGTNIVNVSLGAERVMTLRGKRAPKDPSTAPITEPTEGAERASQKVPLPHNSMFILGLPTNAKWLHAINRDKRPDNIKTEAELSHNGERISLTFRHITTFLSADESLIWGQGATSKTKEDAKPVICGDEKLAEEMIYAFGTENQSSNFDWEGTYGAGFDVLHFKRQEPKIYLSREIGWDINDEEPDHTTELTTASQSVLLALKEMQINCRTEILAHSELKLPSFTEISPRQIAPVFVDVDRERSVVVGRDAILLYLSSYYPSNAFVTASIVIPTKEPSSTSGANITNNSSRQIIHPNPAVFAKIMSNLTALSTLSNLDSSFAHMSKVTLIHELQLWEDHLAVNSDMLKSERPLNLFDWAFLPILQRSKQIGALDAGGSKEKKKRFPGLMRYLEWGLMNENVVNTFQADVKV